MTSQLNVDTIVDKAGSGGTNVKIGNTSTYVSDGGAVTQNTVQGLAKAWVQYDMGDNALDDSLNVSSLSDEATGKCNFTITNAFGAANFAYSGLVGNNCVDIFYNGQVAKTASNTGTIGHLNTSTSDIDVSPYGNIIMHGDLA